MAIQGGQLGGKTPKIAIPRSTVHPAYPNTRWTPVSTKDPPNRPSRGQDSSFLAIFRIFRVTATLRRSKNSVKFEKSSKRPQDPQEGSIMIQICEGITPGGSETAEIDPNLLYMPKSASSVRLVRLIELNIYSPKIRFCEGSNSAKSGSKKSQHFFFKFFLP